MNHQESYEIRREAVANNDWSNQAQWRRLLEEVAKAAATAAQDEHELQDYITQGFSVVSDLVHATNQNAWDIEGHPERKLNMWFHRRQIAWAGKPHGEPYIDRNHVRGAIAGYLAMPYCTDSLDRLLLDLGMAQEMLAFIDEMQPRLKRKLPPILHWLLSNTISVVGGGALTLFFFWIGSNSTILTGIGVVILTITALGLLWSLIAFPLNYPAIRRADQKLATLVNAMQDAYSTLGGQPASTKHIEERVRRGTDAGVVWLAPMIVLLEDIGRRRSSV